MKKLMIILFVTISNICFSQDTLWFNHVEYIGSENYLKDTSSIHLKKTYYFLDSNGDTLFFNVRLFLNNKNIRSFMNYGLGSVNCMPNVGAFYNFKIVKLCLDSLDVSRKSFYNLCIEKAISGICNSFRELPYNCKEEFFISKDLLDFDNKLYQLLFIENSSN